jgi:hypothetical protein
MRKTCRGGVITSSRTRLFLSLSIAGWVPNLYAYFSRSGETLTTEVKPWDHRNLSEWQPGDIVVFGSGYDHIGIVSDKRRRDGVPLVIHHGWACPVEDDVLRYWGDRITGHSRMDLGNVGSH